MKSNESTVILGIALIAVAGLFTTHVAGLWGSQSNTSSLAVGSYMTGHVVTVVTDADGNVKQYRQSDNVVTNRGENCAARLLFATNTTGHTMSNTACQGALTKPYTTIAIGSGTSVDLQANGTNTGLFAEYVGVDGLQRSVGTTVTITNSTAGGASGANTAASIVISKTFTNTSGVSRNVAESGLFNGTSTATAGIFARQTFNTISLSNGDSLTVTWTINIGQTGQFTS